ncbi:hypothetical protein PMAYCL1PPCAC_30490, partial [Pristionchus mayeri]
AHFRRADRYYECVKGADCPLTLRQIAMLAEDYDLTVQERNSYNDWLAKTIRDPRLTPEYARMYGRRPAAPKYAPPGTPKRRREGEKDDLPLPSIPQPFVIHPELFV